MGAPKLQPSFFEEEVGIKLIDAAVKTIESYFGAKPIECPYLIAENLKVHYPLAGVIEFEADGLKVQMLLAFEKEMVLKVYERMLGETLTEITNDVLDCVGELTNTVYGYAKAPLVDKGHSFSMARPHTTYGVNEKLIGKKTLEIPFRVHETAEKEFSLIISL
jgi:chemotaxis protein CheX